MFYLILLFFLGLYGVMIVFSVMNYQKASHLWGLMEKGFLPPSFEVKYGSSMFGLILSIGLLLSGILYAKFKFEPIISVGSGLALSISACSFYYLEYYNKVCIIISNAGIWTKSDGLIGWTEVKEIRLISRKRIYKIVFETNSGKFITIDDLLVSSKDISLLNAFSLRYKEKV